MGDHEPKNLSGRTRHYTRAHCARSPCTCTHGVHAHCTRTHGACAYCARAQYACSLAAHALKVHTPTVPALTVHALTQDALTVHALIPDACISTRVHVSCTQRLHLARNKRQTNERHVLFLLPLWKKSFSHIFMDTIPYRATHDVLSGTVTLIRAIN